MLTKPSIPIRPCVATIGFFDGVHRGHCCLIEQVRQAARQRGLASAVITFPVHPRKVMQCDFRPALLTTCEEKSKLLLATGIDYCFMLPFTIEVSRLSAFEFMQLLSRDYEVRALVIGYDHRFGHNREEGFDDYVRYGDALGMEVLRAEELDWCCPELLPVGHTVSSSAVRALIGQGRVDEAARLLGYHYFVQGTVVGGHRVGRKLGFPTANIRPSDADKLIPADGVYAVWAQVNGETHPGMLSIGCRPTIGNGTDRSIEVHLFDFDRDIYHCNVKLLFVSRLRDEMKFASPEQLTAQLQADEQEARKRLIP